MSLWPLERWAGNDAAPRRGWALRRRAAASTVFLQPDAAWRYLSADSAPLRLSSGLDWLDQLEDCPVRLVLSGSLTHHCVVSDPALPLRDSDALAAWARHQFVHYHGPLAQDWPIATWLDGAQRGASAVHGLDLNALTQRARANRARLLGVYPWWSIALRRATQDGEMSIDGARGELWIVEGVQATRLVCASRRLASIEQHWLERPTTTALGAVMSSNVPDGMVPWVTGYGLEDDGAPEPPVRCLGPLTGPCPASRWVGA